jgi:hypothetical protein
LLEFDDPFVEWDAADEAVVAAAHAPLPRPRRRTCAPTHSCRSPTRGQEIFDEEDKTEEEEPHNYRVIPDLDEDEDTSDDGVQDDDEE